MYKTICEKHDRKSKKYVPAKYVSAATHIN